MNTKTITCNAAPAAELKMPFNPLQNYTMFHNQIRQFLGVDCTVEKVDVAWHEAKRYSVTTVAGVAYEVTLDGDFYVFTTTAATATETTNADKQAPKVAMPEATNATVETAPITASARFFWNGVKIGDSKKLIKVWYSFNKAYPDRQASLMIYTKSSVGELTGLAGLQKNGSDYATDLYLGDCAIITENMPEYIPALTAAETLYTRRSEKGDKLAVSALESIKNELARLAMPVIEVTPAQATAEMPAAEAMPVVETVTDKVEMATIVTHEEAVESFIADTGMADSPITRCRIWVMLSRAGLGDYRVSKRRPEQLLPGDLADPSEPETNVIIDPDGNEVWDAGWASWKERTQRFIETRAKMATEDLEYAKAHMEYNFCLIGNHVAYQNAIANQIATEYTDPRRGTVQCLFPPSS